MSASGCESERQIRIGHSTELPAAPMSKVLGERLSNTFLVTTQPYPNTAAMQLALRNNEIDLAIIEQPQAPIDNISAVIPLFPSVLHVLVKRTIHDCNQPIDFASVIARGSVYAGADGSSGFNLLTLMAQAHLIPAIEKLNVITSPFGIEPDIFIQFGGILSQDAASRLGAYCLASLGNVEQLGKGAWAEGISYRLPHLKPFILPAGLYPNLNNQPILTLAVTSLLVTYPSMEADNVYDIVHQVKEGASELDAIYPLAGSTIHAEFDHELFNIPIHAGTHRYLERNAPTLIERYAELLAFIVTAVVALTSAGVAIMRIRHQAKKDRIDRYFDRLMTLRRENTAIRLKLHNDVNIAAKTDPQQTEQAITDLARIKDEVTELQTTVTKLVVAERIVADSAFVGFLSLSNRVLAEIDTVAASNALP